MNDARHLVGIYANALDREPRLLWPARDDEQIAARIARAHAVREGSEIVVLTEFGADGRPVGRWEVGADGRRSPL